MNPERGMNLFVYGTLQFPDVMEAVTGLRLGADAARLDGYRRFRIRGHAYPGIVEAPGVQTRGRLYRQLPAPAVAALDRFEGDFYERRPVTVVTEDGLPVEAQTYVVASARRPALVTDEPWETDRFEREHLAAFVASYRGFERLRSA